MAFYQRGLVGELVLTTCDDELPDAHRNLKANSDVVKMQPMFAG